MSTDLKLPISYKFQCKRGVSFEERKIELSEKFIKYFNPKTGEERFKSNIEDCILVESSPNVPNILRLYSQTNSFKEIFIRHNLNDMIKKFKLEFEIVKTKKIFLNKIEKSDVIIPEKKEVINNDEFYEAKSSDDSQLLNESKLSDSKITNLKRENEPPLEEIIVENTENSLSFNLNEKINQLLNEKYYSYEYNQNSIVEVNKIEFSNWYKSRSKSFVIKEEIISFFNQIRKTINIYEKLVYLLILINIIILYFYSITITIGLASIYLIILIKIKSRKINNLKIGEKKSPMNDKTFSFRITSYCDKIEISDIINHLNNYKSYCRWNQYFDNYDIKNNKINYTYMKNNEKYEIKELNMNSTCNQQQNKFFYIEYFSDLNLHKIIMIEPNKFNKIKLTLFINVNNAPNFYIRSVLKSQDNFNIYLNIKTCEISNYKFVRLPIKMNISDDQINKTIDTTKLTNHIKENQATIENPNPFKSIINQTENIISSDKLIDNNSIIHPRNSNVSIKPNVPLDPEDELFIKMCDEKFNQYKEFRERDWKIWEEKTDYKIYFIDEKSGLRSIKSEIIINKPLKEVFDFIGNLENKSKYDKNFDTGHTIKTIINEQYNLSYQKYRGKVGVSPRDFTLIIRKIFDTQESFMFATSFVSDKHPKINKVERADYHYGGFVFKRIDDNKILLQFYSCSDLKISQWMVNLSLKEVASCVVTIRNLLIN